jgi:hypothetical protein
LRYLISIFLFLGVLYVGCDDRQPVDRTYKLRPTKDADSPTGVYIPKDLEDCLKELEKMLPPELLHEIKHADSTIKYHLNLGMWIRNSWGLWGNSRLAVYFNSMGIHHPDDMSMIILDSFHRHLNGRPVRLKEQTGFYKNFWEMQTDSAAGSVEDEK